MWYLIGQTLRNFWLKIWPVQVSSRSYDVIRGITSGIFTKNRCFTAPWRDAIDENDNIWTWLGQDVARIEFPHCHSVPWGHLRSVTSDNLTFTSNHIFIIITVSWDGGFGLKGSFPVYVSTVDIPIICACQVTDPWRHKSDLWRHQRDTASSMSTLRPKYSTEIHQNTSFCAELNGEHAGEGPMPLRQIVLLIWTRKVENHSFRKFDLWPAITGSNIDLGPKIIPPIASTRQEQSAGLFLGGGAISSPPPPISETTGPILKIQAAFESPGKIVEVKQILLTSGSRVTSQVRSKSKCSTFRAWWHRRAKLRC